jgi:hypothetical protein
VIPPTLPINPQPGVPEADSSCASHAGASTIKEEEEVLDIATLDTGHARINVFSSEVIFCTKTFNVEKQTT